MCIRQYTFVAYEYLEITNIAEILPNVWKLLDYLIYFIHVETPR
jgi:hypothetical protein